MRFIFLEVNSQKTIAAILDFLDKTLSKLDNLINYGMTCGHVLAFYLLSPVCEMHFILGRYWEEQHVRQWWKLWREYSCYRGCYKVFIIVMNKCSSVDIHIWNDLKLPLNLFTFLFILKWRCAFVKDWLL